MAARRLIAVLIVLLVLSTVAAAIAPSLEEATDDATTTETTTAGEPSPGEPPVRPGLVQGSFDLDAARDDEGAEPPVLRAVRGERIAIAVRSSESAQIRIPELGRLEWTGRGSPARFQLLAREAGELSVRTGDGRIVGRIVIEEAPDKRGNESGSAAGDGPPTEGEGTAGDEGAATPADAGAA